MLMTNEIFFTQMKYIKNSMRTHPEELLLYEINENIYILKIHMNIFKALQMSSN